MNGGGRAYRRCRVKTLRCRRGGSASSPRKIPRPRIMELARRHLLLLLSVSTRRAAQGPETVRVRRPPDVPSPLGMHPADPFVEESTHHLRRGLSVRLAAL